MFIQIIFLLASISLGIICSKITDLIIALFNKDYKKLLNQAYNDNNMLMISHLFMKMLFVLFSYLIITLISHFNQTP
jgi:hypothetical protein